MSLCSVTFPSSSPFAQSSSTLCMFCMTCPNSVSACMHACAHMLIHTTYACVHTPGISVHVHISACTVHVVHIERCMHGGTWGWVWGCTLYMCTCLTSDIWHLICHCVVTHDDDAVLTLILHTVLHTIIDLQQYRITYTIQSHIYKGLQQHVSLI